MATMEPLSALEAQNLADFARSYLEDLTHAAQSEQTSVDAQERGWLQLAADRVCSRLLATDAALLAGWPLPELEAVRKRELRSRQEAWGDTVAKLYAGIVDHTSENGPLVEVLFAHCRFEKLSRPGASSDQFHGELVRRRRTQYVQRMSAEPEYSFLNPLFEQVDAAREALEQCQHPAETQEEQLVSLRAGIAECSMQLSLSLEQARALATAALVASPEQMSTNGLAAKPRRRSSRRPPVN